MRTYIAQTWGWDEAVQEQMFRERFDPATLTIIELDERPIGVLSTTEADRAIELGNIEILPEHQRRGYGAVIVGEVLTKARSRCHDVRLQVLKVNPARTLYERLGFEVTGATPTHYLMRARATTSPKTSPPESVVRAFGIVEGLVQLRGGRGNSWATSSAVLKPVEDVAEASWIADLAAPLEPRRFRLARPIAAADKGWIVDGWSAWTRVAGEHSVTRWPELLAAATAFHAAVVNVPKPEFIDRRDDRWRIADRVAWGELPAREFATVPHLERLLGARRSLNLDSQLIHGDLVGNVLFADGLPPAIIDLSLYWRPVGYSAALVVGDALAWEGAEPSILGLLQRFAEWPQLLLRAVIFRIVVSELARRAEPGRNDLSEHYRALVDLALSTVS